MINYKKPRKTEIGIRNEAIIEAYKKGYRVSDCGQKVIYKEKERKLQTVITLGKPYFRFSVGYKGSSTNIMVHRLQAYQKYKNRVFTDSLVVRHKNDNSLDNSKKNILLGTLQDNSRDRYRNKNKNHEAPF